MLKYYTKSRNYCNNEEIDCDFVHLLLVSFVNVNDLTRMEISKDVLDLIKGNQNILLTYNVFQNLIFFVLFEEFFDVRVGENSQRKKNFDKYVQQKCKELSEKERKKKRQQKNQ